MPTPHIGAEAIVPVVQATGRIQGNHATPVYVYTSIPADRRGLGMAAQPVYFISDSDLVENGGKYKLEGRLTALPVIQLPAGSRAIGMPAIPVYDVTNKAWPPVATYNPNPTLAYSSSEIGNVDPSTVVVTFSDSVVGQNYSFGVTIKVNGTPVSILSATRQSNHALVYYVLSVTCLNTDVITWGYVKDNGFIQAETTGAVLPDTSAQTVTNNIGGGGGLPFVGSATLLLDLQADALALNDGDPVSTWADASGLHHDFTQSGNARPTFRANVGGKPCIEFDGIDDWLGGQNFADALTDFAVFIVYYLASPTWANPAVLKVGNFGCSDPGSNGWVVDPGSVTLMDDVTNQTFQTVPSGHFGSDPGIHLSVGEILNHRPYTFFDGVKDQFYPNGGLDSGTGALSYATTEPIRLCTDGLGASGDNSCNGYDPARVFAVLIYRITDTATWVASDRHAVEQWVGAKYGVVIP